MWIHFIAGLFLGTAAGIFVASLCQMAARSKGLRNASYHHCHGVDSGATQLANPALHDVTASPQ
jgi:hypothetical protein